MSWLNLDGRVAAVTGGAGGIGEAVVLELARNGASVAVLDVNADGAEETAGQARAHGVDAFSARVDTTDQDAVDEALELVTRRWGRVDVLVNNAGTSVPKPLSELSLAEWQGVLNVNLTGYFLCAQRFGSVMRRNGGGSLIHVASIAGHHPQTNSSSYSPSKAGVLMLSRALAVEWGPSGIRSNTVSPGMTRTPLTEQIYQVPGVLEMRSALAPLGRIATVQDMADACAWLASDRSSFVTGQDIVVDGGFSQTVVSRARAASPNGG